MIRFWEKAELQGDCFIWVAGVSNVGYGKFQLDRRTRLAHRVAYELIHGEIPHGLTVDHLCRNKRCVNVMHMELVTLRENIQRKVFTPRTHCSKGHEFTKDNTYTYYKTKNSKKCRRCHANKMYKGLKPRYKYKEEA